MGEPLEESRESWRRFLLFTLVAVVFYGGFSIFAAVDPVNLRWVADEDQWVEDLTALLFFLSALGFVGFMVRSGYLRERPGKLVYFFPACWALLMFVFAGEEISWGQRIFGFDTPAWVYEENLQHEFNLHNLGPLDVIMGGKYRYLSIMMLSTGLVLPVFARIRWGLRAVRTTAFPILPIAYSAFFVGAYLFCHFGYATIDNDAAEIREFGLSVGMVLFGWHAWRRPQDPYLLREDSLAADEFRAEPSENAPA